MFPLSTFCSVTGTGFVEVLPMITFVNGVAAPAMAPPNPVVPTSTPTPSSAAMRMTLRM